MYMSFFKYIYMKQKFIEIVILDLILILFEKKKKNA